MQLKARILCRELTEQIFVPLDPKVRMQTTLHQDTGTAEGNGLVDLFANLIEGANIRVRRPGPPVKSTEGADYVADVRIVDIAIDDVGDDVIRMLAPANLIGRRRDAGDIVGFKQRRAVGGAQALAAERLVQDRSNLGVRHRPLV